MSPVQKKSEQKSTLSSSDRKARADFRLHQEASFTPWILRHHSSCLIPYVPFVEQLKKLSMVVGSLEILSWMLPCEHKAVILF